MATDQPQVWDLADATTRRRLPAFVYTKVQAAAERRDDSSIRYQELTVDLTNQATAHFSVWFDPNQPYWMCSSGSRHWIQIHGTYVAIEPINDPPDLWHIWVVQILATDNDFLVGVLCVTTDPYRKRTS